MKARPSKLDAHAARLEEWFLEGKTLREAQGQLALDGVKVSLGRLSQWWEGRQAATEESKLLMQIATGAAQCKDVESALASNPAPALDTIIRLHRVLILKLTTKANSDPEMLELVGRLMKPTMEFAKLQEKRRELELAEQKYRDQVAERKAAIERELVKAKATGGVSDETFDLVERELKLL